MLGNHISKNNSIFQSKNSEMLKQLGLKEIKSEYLDKTQKDKKIYEVSEKIYQFNINKMNLDSRINSQNDISKLKESNILKNNSFFSQNF